MLEATIALASVILGWLLAVFTQRAASKQQERDAQLAAARSVFMKVQRYAVAVVQMARHIHRKGAAEHDPLYAVTPFYPRMTSLQISARTRWRSSSQMGVMRTLIDC